MKKSILILGGTGTLSKTIAINSEKTGYDVSVLNRGNHNNLLPDVINKIKGNFYDSNNLSNCVEGKKFDIIIDFLSRRKSDIYRVFPILSSKCNQYILISSACVFRRSPEDFPIVETSPKPNTKWKYNIEKYEAETSLIQLSKESFPCKYTIVRPYITYDEHRIPIAIAPNYAYHQTLIERIKKGKKMFLIDDGEAISTVTYVEDFAKGVLGLFLNEKAYNEDFNVVSDFHYSHKEILEKLFRKIGVAPNIINIPRETIAKYLPNYAEMVLGDRALNAIFDNSKLKKAIPGLHFEYNLEKGLDKVLQYYESNYKYSLIDYKYDGQIDYLLKKHSNISRNYYKYNNIKGFITYSIFSIIPIKIMIKCQNFIKKMKSIIKKK